MNSWSRYAVLIWVALSANGVSAGAALAASPASGVFLGNFESTCGAGSFALIAATGTAEGVFLAIRNDSATHRLENLAVNEDNELEILSLFNSNTSISGKISRTEFSGIIKGGNCSGTISGLTRGSMGSETVAGYYSDPITVTRFGLGCNLFGCRIVPFESFPAHMSLIMAEDLSGYVLFQSSRPRLLLSDGGSLSFEFNNSLSQFRMACIPNVRCDLLNDDIFGWIACPSPGCLRTNLGLREPSFSARYSVDLNANDFVSANPGNINRDQVLPRVPPVAVNDIYIGLANRSLTVSAAEGVLANDSNPEGDPLTALLITSPTQGNVSLSASGAFTYTPNQKFVGVDSFTYRAHAGFAQSNVATVTITVEPVKAMPWLGLLLLDD